MTLIAPWWDYGRDAAYFVTICTQYRVHYFGHIIKGKMMLSEIGNMVRREWIITPEIRWDMNLTLGAYVVMPNHFHAIIIIGQNRFNTPPGTERLAAGDDDGGGGGRDAMHRVSTIPTKIPIPTPTAIPPTIPTTIPIPTPMAIPPATPTNYDDEKSKNQFGPQSKNLASIIRGFKSSVTKNARVVDTGFVWQSRYHDHIIRNEPEYQRISNYIINNPSQWREDRFYVP